MRRVILLALLAIALPTAALADSTGINDYQASNPTSVTTSSSSLSVTFSTLSVNSGTFGAGTVKIWVSLGSSCGAGCFNITGGSVSIWNGSSVSLFNGVFSSGTVLMSGKNPSNITISGFTTGGNTVAGIFKLGKTGWGGSADVFVTPEPGTLGLLGTGLVGLAGIVRRKLRT